MTGQRRSDSDDELADLQARAAALREAAAGVGAPFPDLVQACLTELDYAIGRLRRAGTSGTEVPRAESPSGERRLLDALFRGFPLPALVLAASGTIRRANAAAAELLGVPVSQLTGKPVTVFVELPARAPFRTALAAAARSDEPSGARTRVLRQGTTVDARVTFTPLPVLASGVGLLLATFGEPATASAVPATGPQAADPARPGEVLAQALDLVGALARLLLDPNGDDPMGRAAELIARTLSDLVIIDLVGESGLRQAAVAGPSGSAGAEVAVVSGCDPAANGVGDRVLATGRPVLTELIDDDHALGDGAEGVGLLDALKAVSLMCVPIPGPSGAVGTLTCIRGEGRPVHGFWELQCLEGTAAQLGLAVPAARAGTRPEAGGAGATGETSDAAGSGETGDASGDGDGEFGDASRAGGADSAVRTGQADGTVRAGVTDGAVRTGQADGTVRAGETDGTVRAGETDGTVRTGRADGTTGTGQAGGAAGTGRTGGAAGAGKATGTIETAGTVETAPTRSGERSGVGEE